MRRVAGRGRGGSGGTAAARIALDPSCRDTGARVDVLLALDTEAAGDQIGIGIGGLLDGIVLSLGS